MPFLGRWNMFNSADESPTAPASGGEAVVPHATNPLPEYTRALYVGGAGNVVCRLIDDDDDTTFTAVPAGTVLPIRVSHIRATSTATNMVALY
jgi:hypothetical protein